MSRLKIQEARPLLGEWIAWSKGSQVGEQMPDGMWNFLQDYGGVVPGMFGAIADKSNCIEILEYWQTH